MALPASPTLGEIRDRVLTRLRMGGAGRLSTRAQDSVDEYIYDAHAELVEEAPWVILQQDELVDLVDAQRDYDIPDGWLPGNISQINILSEVNGETREYRLERGIRDYERDALSVDANDKSLPLRWDVVNQLIQILPVPDTSQYQQMRISGLKSPTPPRDDDDKVSVDETALVQRATIIGWVNLGEMSRASTLEVRHARYLRRRAAAEAIHQPIVLGGRRSKIHNRPRRRNTVEEVDYNFWFPRS